MRKFANAKTQGQVVVWMCCRVPEFCIRAENDFVSFPPIRNTDWFRIVGHRLSEDGTKNANSARGISMNLPVHGTGCTWILFTCANESKNRQKPCQSDQKKKAEAIRTNTSHETILQKRIQFVTNNSTEEASHPNVTRK